jgi:hypothetical protein
MNVSASASGGAVTVSWTPADALASGFDIYGYIGNNTPNMLDEVGYDQTTDSLSNLTPGQPYTFYVVATNPAGQSGDSNTATANSPGLPAQPAGLAASLVDGNVQLSWTANDDSLTSGYNIYQANSGGSPVLIDSVDGSTTTYTVSNPTPGTSPEYFITAEDASGESELSTAATLPVAIPTGGVSGVTAVASPDGSSVTINWTGDGNASGYIIGRTDDADASGTVVPVGTVIGGTITTLTDTASDAVGTLDPTKAYTYTVEPYYGGTTPAALDTAGTGAPATADDYTNAIGNLKATVNLDNSVTFAWSYQGQGTPTFELDDADQSMPSATYAYLPDASGSVSESSGIYSTTVPAGDLYAGDTYGFRIRADNADGTVSQYASTALKIEPPTLSQPAPSFTLQNVEADTGGAVWDADIHFDTSNGLPDLPSGESLQVKVTQAGDPFGLLPGHAELGFDSTAGLPNLLVLGTNGATYTIVLYAEDSNGELSPPSAPIPVTLGGSATPPTITLTSAGAGIDVVNWPTPQNYPYGGIEFFRVVDGGEAATAVDTTNGSWSLFSAGAATLIVPPGTSSVFAIALGSGLATSGGGPSAYSNQVVIQNPIAIPTAPASISAVTDPNDNTQVDIQWPASTNAVTSYILQRSDGTDGFATIATLPADTTSYVDSIPSNIDENLSEQYQIIAVDGQAQAMPRTAEVTDGIAPILKTVPAGEVIADFTNGNGTNAVDKYLGKAGNGWAGSWASLPSHYATLKGTAVDTSPLESLSNGYYLSASVATTAHTGYAAVSRDYNGTGGIDPSSNQDITFYYRYDGLSEGTAATGDNIELFGNTQAEELETPSDTWEGVASLTPGSSWEFGNIAGTLWPSGVELAQNHVYRFIIAVYPSLKDFAVDVTDFGTGDRPLVTKKSPSLPFPNQSADGSDYLEAGMYLGARKTAKFSLDNVSITGSSSAPPAPMITTNLPANVDVAPGSPGNPGNDYTFTPVATGYTSVQWYVKTPTDTAFQQIYGETGSTYTLAGVNTTESGNQYEAILTNAAGLTATTNVTTLTVPTSGGNLIAPDAAPPGDTAADISEQVAVQTMIQNDLNAAEDGGSLTFPAGTYELSAPLEVYTNTLIKGVATGRSFSTDLDATLPIDLSNPADQQVRPYVFVLAGSDANVTIEGLDIQSNGGIVDMTQGSSYDNITITENELQYRTIIFPTLADEKVQEYGEYIAYQDGAQAEGINDTVAATNLDVTYNLAQNSPDSDRFAYTSNSTDAEFDNNEFEGVNAGVQFNYPNGGCTFNDNFGTGLYNKALETAMDFSPGFEANGNEFYNWTLPQDNSFGLSVVELVGSTPYGQLITVNNNWIDVNAPGKLFGYNPIVVNHVVTGYTLSQESGPAYEVDGYPLSFNGNTGGVTNVVDAEGDPNAIADVQTKDAGANPGESPTSTGEFGPYTATGMDNNLYGGTNVTFNGVPLIAPEQGGPNKTNQPSAGGYQGNWAGMPAGGDTAVSADGTPTEIGTPPPNDFAGPENEPPT